MSSWTSHLPRQPATLEVTGLGMNLEELQRNPRLTRHIVHDLNRDPRLPCAEHSFDLALCAVSVEYLTQPLAVFEDLRRVLRPGAVLLCVFSERWFPPKAIDLWSQLHPFERLGLVLDYYRRSGYHGLRTETVRGLPRPQGDKYARLSPLSDPLYAAWGQA